MPLHGIVETMGVMFRALSLKAALPSQHAGCMRFRRALCLSCAPLYGV